MKKGKLLLLTSMVALATATSAQTIEWAATTIEDETAVLTEGTLIEAVNLSSGVDGTIYNTTINTVEFKGVVSGDVGNAWDTPTTDYFSANSSNVVPEHVDNYDSTGIAAYDVLMSRFLWTNDPTTVTLSMLESGKSYKIQLLVGDTRASQDGSFIVIDGSFGSAETTAFVGPKGLSIVGSFTAESETISFEMSKHIGENAQGISLNGYQLRQVEGGTTGIEDQTQLFRAYPNPANGVINVDCAKGSKIELFSINGACVRSVVAEGTTVQVSTSGMKAGMYIVKLTNTIGSYTQRLQVK